MSKVKVPPADLKDLAEIYNNEGAATVKEVLAERYDIHQPSNVLKRMKSTEDLEYDAKLDRFFAQEEAESESIFMSIEELCTTPSKSSISQTHISVDAQNAAMERMVQNLIGERLLELSRYITLSSLSRTVIVDRTALESEGYHLEIH